MKRTDDEWVALAVLAGADLQYAYDSATDQWVAGNPFEAPAPKIVWGTSKADCARTWLALHDKLPSR